MARGARDSQWPGYVGAVTMLVLALLFPVGLMIFNPTLMFERGWEQYVGTGIYFWAVLTLSRELVRLWRNERAFDDAPALLKRVNAAMVRGRPRDGSPTESAISDANGRILPLRIRQLVSYLKESGSPSVTQLMEVNRESSGLDQEQMAGRFTLDPVHSVSLAGDWIYRHSRGNLQGPDEYQQSAADGEEPGRFPDQSDQRDGGLADRLRQHAAGVVPERVLDARPDARPSPVGRLAGAGRPLGGRSRAVAGRHR